MASMKDMRDTLKSIREACDRIEKHLNEGQKSAALSEFETMMEEAQEIAYDES